MSEKDKETTKGTKHCCNLKLYFSFVGLGLVGWHKLRFEGTDTDTLRFIQKNKKKTFFQHFSRTQIDFSRTLKFKLFFHSQNRNVNYPYCLPYISYFLLEVNIFIELFRIISLFPRLSSPGKCHNKIPGFSRTHTNPVANSVSTMWLDDTVILHKLWYNYVDLGLVSIFLTSTNQNRGISLWGSFPSLLEGVSE